MPTVFFLHASNTFMTFTRHGHLKHKLAFVWMVAVLVNWFIAFGGYCFQVSPNRPGYGIFSAFPFTIIQKCLTLTYAPSMLCILTMVMFACRGKE